MSSKLKRQKSSSIFNYNNCPNIKSTSLVEGYLSKIKRQIHVHHDRVEILFMASGGGFYFIDGENYKVEKGDIIIYNSGVIHEEMIDLGKDVSMYGFCVKNLSIKGMEANKLIEKGKMPIIKTGDRYDEFKNIFSMIYKYSIEGGFDSLELVNHLIISIIILIHDISFKYEKLNTSNKQKLSEDIRNYMDKYLYTNISLKTISDEFKLSKYYIAHLYKEVTGYSPMQYVIRRRIGEAQTMLLHTDNSIIDIAINVGFNSVNHFHSTFVKIVGISPGKYRKIWRTNEIAL